MFYFTDPWLLMFHKNTEKILEILNKWNLLRVKTWFQTTYPIGFAYILNIGKWKYSIFLEFAFTSSV